jgi:hypothetical protein
MRAYRPSPSEKIALALSDGLRALGMDNYNATSGGRTVRDVLGLTPLGIPMAIGDMRHAMGEGDYLGTAVNAAGALPMARPAAIGARFARNSGASKEYLMYDFPTVNRSFVADYPKGVASEPGQKLATDIEGRPLRAETVVGRRVVGGEDQALAPAEYDSFGTRLVGSGPESVPPGRGTALGNSLGHYQKVSGSRFAPDTDGIGRLLYDNLYNRLPKPMYRPEWDDGTIKRILVSNKLPADVAGRVVNHEFGHAIQDIVGDTSRNGFRDIDVGKQPDRVRLIHQLQKVYKDGSGGLHPSDFNYKPTDYFSEMWAEAGRAYLTNPSYIKEEAPEVAATLRKYVNVHPWLSRHLNFNSLAGVPAAGVVGASAFGSLAPEQQ